MARTKTFDYVIVGAGSAGCTLANRLTEDPDSRVLILEAGGWDRDPWIHIPLGWGRLIKNRLHDWMYFAEPNDVMNGRSIECARGKVVGGSSSINAMAYVRGHRLDFDRWAESGAAGWSYADVLPYFRKQESWEGGANDYRGGNGPLATQVCKFEDSLISAYGEAGKNAGYAWTDDYNGENQEGFGRLQMTIKNGRRSSGATAYLRPAAKRKNLQIGKLDIQRHLVAGEAPLGAQALGELDAAEQVVRPQAGETAGEEQQDRRQGEGRSARDARGDRAIGRLGAAQRQRHAGPGCDQRERIPAQRVRQVGEALRQQCASSDP